jgi:hypothetical protein
MWSPVCDYIKLESTDKLPSEILAEEMENQNNN